ncbi:hypothetical protein ABZZ80_45965, partial [Streptomyces sp. NPDC006356]
VGDAIMIDSDDAALTRTIVHARADLLGTPRAGREYRSLLLAGGVIGRDQADEWLAEQRRHAEAGRFPVAIPVFVASASV